MCCAGQFRGKEGDAAQDRNEFIEIARTKAVDEVLASEVLDLDIDKAPVAGELDKIAFTLRQRGWKDSLGQVKVQGQGGDLRLDFSTKTIQLGNIPVGTSNSREVVVSNTGTVAVELGTSCKDKATTKISRSTKGEVGVLSVRAPDPFKLDPGQQRTVIVKFAANESGDIDLGFKLNLLGTTREPPTFYQFSVKGRGDQIKMSDAMMHALHNEVLPCTHTEENTPNTHLSNVLMAYDHIPSVSVHHLVAPVEPLLRHRPVDTNIPLPLTTATLKAFKKWFVLPRSITACLHSICCHGTR